MEKIKRWHVCLILAVFAWTVYTILPSIIYYAKPLDRPIDGAGASLIESEMVSRLDGLKSDATDWISAFCKMVGVTPKNIQLDEKDPGSIFLEVSSDADVARVRNFFPQAGYSIPFKPSQLFLGNIDGRKIQIIRRLGVDITEKNKNDFFSFVEKKDASGKVSNAYFDLVKDRFVNVSYALFGPSSLSKTLVLALGKQEDKQSFQQIVDAISEWSTFKNSPLFPRLIASIFQGNKAKTSFDTFLKLVAQEQEAIKTKIGPTSVNQAETNKELSKKLEQLEEVASLLNSKGIMISNETQPLTKETIETILEKAHSQHPEAPSYTLSYATLNPLIAAVTLDWSQDTISIQLHEDVISILKGKASTEEASRLHDAVYRMVLNAIATLSQETDESIETEGEAYTIALSSSSSNGLIVLSLKKVAGSMAESLLNYIQTTWHPESPDLQADVYPHLNGEQFLAAPADERSLCLVVFSPSATPMKQGAFKNTSLYIILRNGQKLFENKGEEAATLKKDVEKLVALLQQRGFMLYSGKMLQSKEFDNDFVFELENFQQPLIDATRESFITPGHQSFSILDCGTYENRITAENKIDDLMQDELIKWKEAWQSAEVSLNPADHFLVPKPTKNIFWANIKRSARKYFRGDDSRIIKWGLDLSGGKSVRISLLDQANRPVTQAEDLKQATSELYSRLNKMGVSERTLRIENGTILIDFPGARDVSASELVKASAMYFHVTNEQFNPTNSELAKASNDFLQEVWNEAALTNAKDTESINKIALKKVQAVESGLLIDQNIQTLLDHGLKLEDPSQPVATSAFDDKISIIARWHGDSPEEWPSRTHPLLIVFKNFALEGCNLENVHPSYDPSKGNILVFNVRGSDARGHGIHPRDEFYTWTSQFSEEGIMGTPREQYSKGRGWRMAVILNGNVVSAPALSCGLRDSAMITGNFTQREVERLARSLQAGSLSFTPKILSEQNVSPDLGARERHQGLFAATLSIIAVISIMIACYHFAGIIASLAVLFNLLIIWAVMQNIEAAITLPAIAGIVLTVALAVDANVLVFERIREEFSISGRIATSIVRGYQKALSAIVDSNLTTLIASFILTQFDCGPVRGFAVTLIIGLLSSLFTSLFVTRCYFTHWAQNPAHTMLKMSQWIKPTNFNFLAFKKLAFLISFVVVAIGVVVTSFSWKSMLGMDFTGGYALIIDVTNTNISPKEVAEKALVSKGISPGEIQIRELGRPNALRIQLSSSIEEEGKPFHGLPESSEGHATYEYQHIPRLNFVVDTLEQANLTIDPETKGNLTAAWTSISGQFSDTMRNNALLAMSLAIVAILIYIAIRFEWKYAISAVLALLQDVLLTLATIAILHFFGMPIQINLEVIGAIMTIIGYALNDTIIIFDRVREDLLLYRKKRFSEIVNLALNSTLSRTLMTSGITLAVLLFLTLFGGSSIFSFSFVMFTGVFLGTLSSLFIAGPLLIFFHMRDELPEG